MQQLLRELLVHRGGTREDAGTDVGHTGHFEQTLDRAVLAEAAVQDGEDDVHRLENRHADARIDDPHQTAGGRVRGEHDRGPLLDLGQRLRPAICRAAGDASVSTQAHPD